MNIIPYSPNKVKLDAHIVTRYYTPINHKLQQIYGFSNPNIYSFNQILALGDPKGKTILDLGCGYVNCKDSNGSSFEPWLSRSLYLLGADVIGLDIGPIGGEIFKSRVVDLTKENCLSFLDNSSIDIAIASSLFDSPKLINSNISIDLVYANIYSQLKRVIKKEGHFIFDVTNTKYDLSPHHLEPVNFN